VAHRVLKGRGDSMHESVDVIIIGAGSAGLAALREVKKRTERDVAAVPRRVRTLRDDFVAGNLDVTDGLGERAISGRARVLGANRVGVAGQK
jgi:hypothetical protein